jgi:hypothetical protein
LGPVLSRVLAWLTGENEKALYRWQGLQWAWW